CPPWRPPRRPTVFPYTTLFRSLILISTSRGRRGRLISHSLRLALVGGQAKDSKRRTRRLSWASCRRPPSTTITFSPRSASNGDLSVERFLLEDSPCY